MAVIASEPTMSTPDTRRRNNEVYSSKKKTFISPWQINMVVRSSKLLLFVIIFFEYLYTDIIIKNYICIYENITVVQCILFLIKLIFDIRFIYFLINFVVHFVGSSLMDIFVSLNGL
jgi:hypothetical protein